MYEEVTEDGLICTWGRLTDSGGLEVLEGNRLLVYDNGTERIATTVSEDGKRYVAAPIDPLLKSAVCFPQKAEAFGTLEALIAEVGDAVAAYLPIDQPTRLLLAAYILSTWIAECVPTPPVLNLWGCAGTEATLVELLRCLCRRSLVVADMPLSEAASLPAGLLPTLILTQPSRRTAQTLLAAAAMPQHTLMRRGELVSLRHAAVVCTRHPLPAPALAIPLMFGAGSYHRFSDDELEHLRENLPAKLLRFRLTHHRLVKCSRFDCTEFAPATAVLVRSLGTPLEGSPMLQARLVAALRSADEQSKVEHSQQLPALVVEALLVLCRENRSAAYVEEITTLVNGILLGRQDKVEVSAKKVGGILRHELGVYAKRQGHGYQVVFDKQVHEHIKTLAQSYGVLSSGISELDDSAVPTSPSTSNVHDVHHVHAGDALADNNVHYVHEVHAPAGEGVA